jgi:hypothetical protein
LPVTEEFCADGLTSFELSTGYVLTSPAESMTMLPGTLQLTQCIDMCRTNETCRAINFETGLCVLLASDQFASALSVAQFPLFTIYAQKICLPSKSWFCFTFASALIRSL